MIIDTSAIVAVLLKETDAKRYREALIEAAGGTISTPTYLETIIVTDSRIENPNFDLDIFLADSRILIAPFTAEHARIARDAHRRYGRGNHPAKLNFGDCAAYALAKATGAPLLYKGDDFSQTDVIPALD